MSNVDDLESAARRGWNRGYVRSVSWMSVASVFVFVEGVGALVVVYWLVKRRTKSWVGRQGGGVHLA